VLGRFFNGMVDNAVQAQLTYDGAFLDCDEDPLTGVDGRETAICPPTTGSFRINECDSLCDVNPEPECSENITDIASTSTPTAMSKSRPASAPASMARNA
jgi:hypothetical protein